MVKYPGTIRKLLKEYPDGLTLREVYEVVKANKSNVLRSLKAMPDVYLDR